MTCRARLPLFSAVLIGAPVAVAAAQIPDVPVIATAKAGPCKMTIQGGPSSFLAIVTGLAPGELLRITSDSEGEVMKWETRAQDDGRLAQIIIPLVRGKTFGTAFLRIAGQRCQIEASYPWRE